jgi:hypothetical protein
VCEPGNAAGCVGIGLSRPASSNDFTDRRSGRCGVSGERLVLFGYGQGRSSFVDNLRRLKDLKAPRPQSNRRWPCILSEKPGYVDVRRFRSADEFVGGELPLAGEELVF